MVQLKGGMRQPRPALWKDGGKHRWGGHPMEALLWSEGSRQWRGGERAGQRKGCRDHTTRLGLESTNVRGKDWERNLRHRKGEGICVKYWGLKPMMPQKFYFWSNWWSWGLWGHWRETLRRVRHRTKSKGINPHKGRWVSMQNASLQALPPKAEVHSDFNLHVIL